MIPLYLPYLTGNEIKYISEVVDNKKLSGNGHFTQKCQNFFEKKWGFKKALLTNSCTDALEMCTLILNLQPGDEIIVPSFTFVSTVSAFFNFGIKPVFVDCQENLPNIDSQTIRSKISPNTKAIVVMHYGGIACDMDEIKQIATENNLYLIEDAALALGSYYKNQPLGSFGDLSTFSFHETKNITCGEGGMLVINNENLINQSEIVWEKGTNRSAFLRGEADEYTWISKGSSFLTSEIHAAFLFAQLENFDEIHHKRIKIWEKYSNELKCLPRILLPYISETQSINGSIYYIILENMDITKRFIEYMAKNGIYVSTHYKNLHESSFYKSRFLTEKLINCEKIAPTLVRLPVYPDLSANEQEKIINNIKKFNF